MNRSATPQFQFQLTPVVKKLLIINVVIWVVFQLLLDGFGGLSLTKWFSLTPGRVVYDYFLWQPFTYMFLHSATSVSHIVFNMLMLCFVGGELEQRWGAKYFTTFYLLTGIGAALLYTTIVAVYSAVTGSQQGLVIPVVGASGAIYGLLLAYGILFGERTVHFMMVFPMKAKYFVMLLGGIEFISILTTGVTGGEVAYLAHLGGLASGYLVLITTTRLKQRKSRNAAKKKSNLRLVVDNEKKTGEDPRYWN